MERHQKPRSTRGPAAQIRRKLAALPSARRGRAGV
jgi:hypothetical protein